VSWYFGADSGTTTNTCGRSFYIGRIGSGTSTVNYTYFVLSDTVDIPAYTFWNVRGPAKKPTASPSNAAWGSAQADAYWTAYGKAKSKMQKPGQTLFGQISKGAGGWSTETTSENRKVVNGFLRRLASKAGSDFTVGIAGSQSGELYGFLKADEWTSPEEIVVWTEDHTSDTVCSYIESIFCPMPDVGGYEPMIWQYHGNPDHDITPYNGGISGSPLRWNPTKVGTGECG
jgi:hypothetical protein